MFRWDHPSASRLTDRAHRMGQAHHRRSPRSRRPGSPIYAALLISLGPTLTGPPQYRATDIVVKEPGKLELVYTPDDKSVDPTRLEVYHFNAPGMGLAMYNTQQVSRAHVRATRGALANRHRR